MLHVVKAFLQFFSSDRVKLKPIWCYVDKKPKNTSQWNSDGAQSSALRRTDSILRITTKQLGERSISLTNRGIIKVMKIERKPEDEIKAKIKERRKEWGANKKGTQIHSSVNLEVTKIQGPYWSSWI